MPDAPGADVLVVVGADGRVALVQAADAAIEPVDGLRRDPLARPTCASTDAPAEVLDVTPQAAATAWYVAQALLAAEAVGAIELALETSVALRQGALHVRPRDRLLPGRQARAGGDPAAARERPLAHVLHGLGGPDKPEELPVAASAFRLVASEAYDHAARAQISVHGGIGATWEHDAPLYFRRAQLDKRLLGGTGDAADRVADELFAQARAAAARPAPDGRCVWTHDRWRFPLPERHRFPIDKYTLLRERVVADGIVRADEVLEPDPVPWAWLEAVHDGGLLERIRGRRR